MHQRSLARRGVSRVGTVAVVVIIIVILGVAGFVALSQRTSTNTTNTTPTTSTATLPTSTSATQPTTSSTSSSSFTTSSSNTTAISTTSSSTSSSQSAPSTFTYETVNTPRELDPQVSYAEYDYNILQNLYETLLWYNGTTSSTVIPWLAQNYTISADGLHVQFTLRQGITFEDGEPLNSTAAYFALNRLLIEDGSAPNSFGTQGSWVVQQLLNTSLSFILGGPHAYTEAWAREVLAQNFVQITGPYTFTLNIQNPNAALPFLFANQWSALVAPSYVMQHDLALWSNPSNGYKLPYTSLSGNFTQRINEYFLDEVNTCGTGATPSGCGVTYLDYSQNGSLAGSGPYILSSFDLTTNDFVLHVNPSYWGGPFQFTGGEKIVPTFKTIDINYIPQLTTREIDLKTAASSGAALAIDIPNTNLYDIANANLWKANHTLASIVPGVSLYGPYTGFNTNMELFATNVTNQQTGQLYKFQPFADLRLRLAFADGVNMTQINADYNNNVGQVAINGMPPGYPPPGTYNASITPRYSYNLTAVQDLMLSAMEHPLTSFTFKNGTAAPVGYFNNTFGCPVLAPSGTCAHPVPQSITIAYPAGQTVDEQVMTEIATAINNVSTTYNMGLTVSVVPIPLGQQTVDGFSGYLYMWSSSANADYPWAIDFLGPLYDPNNIFTGPAGWNITIMSNLFNQAVKATSNGNISGVVAASDLMNQISNEEVQYLWTIYPEFIQPITSNVRGLTYNPAIYGTIEYFAYIS